MSKSLTDLMMERFEKPKKRGGINNPFSDAVAQVMNEIKNIDPRTKKEWTFGRWCGFLKGVPPYEILSFLKQARRADHPGKIFNWNIKQYKNGKG